MTFVFSVPQSHCVILERFGKFSRVCNQGLHIRMPILETIKRLPEWGRDCNKHGYMIELSEQQTDTPPRQCHTKDNVAITANASVYWRVVEPVRAVYEVDILPRSVSDIALNALRANIGSLELDEVLSERNRLNDRIAAQLSKVAQKWGLQFTRVEIQELTTTDDTASAMRQQMEGERRRRAMVAEATGRAESELKVAEAEQRATVLRAKGQAEALTRVAEAEATYLAMLSKHMDAQSAVAVLIAQKQLESIERISRNPAHKVFLPASFQGLLTINEETGSPSSPRANGPARHAMPPRIAEADRARLATDDGEAPPLGDAAK